MDRIPERLGEIERLWDVLWVRLRCRRGRFSDDEVLEQHAARLGLQRLRVACQEVIAEGALLLVTDLVGLQNLLPTLRARHHEGHGALAHDASGVDMALDFCRLWSYRACRGRSKPRSAAWEPKWWWWVRSPCVPGADSVVEVRHGWRPRRRLHVVRRLPGFL